ncbi:MAG: RNA polymerase-binding ATPase [Gammaproteobacteria bacterium]|nr:MAG: RNA polymerase-binding ATPase [Gammaproteobacteria bacterium]
MTSEFVAGQRWISDAEPDLGLGTVIEVEHRQVAVVFLASGETRRYARETAPLTRVIFNPGDEVDTHDGETLLIESLDTSEGLISYSGTGKQSGDRLVVLETRLDHTLQFRHPRDRLFNGLIDGNRWYRLRRAVFEHRHRAARSPVRGLAGARVSVLPHQIHIASEAIRREHPRLLLADEVGLGKTIEAGMILQASLVRHLVERAIIIVPSALVHQWLVEILRKFGIQLHLIDTDRFAALKPDAPEGNPFLAEQLVLCSLEELSASSEMQADLVAADWDMLIVDEAHHLNPLDAVELAGNDVGIEADAGAETAESLDADDSDEHAYELVRSLAERTPAVLLLTATPEQLGRSGHFARLKLLDPERFSTLANHLADESHYAEIAAIASKLADGEALDETAIAAIESRIDETLDATARDHLLSHRADAETLALRDQLLDKLIDRHGTSRLMFRNTRQSVAGEADFPGRKLVVHALQDDSLPALADWLRAFLTERFPERVLLICHRAGTVVALHEELRRLGIASARFHEGMSIVERDRAAAWFADTEDDCRILLCSEIGSEGRNFQFLHLLVTIELPHSPDLLEQRIGRLDRIGQRQQVEIHVPVKSGSVDQARLRWFHEGLDAVETLAHGAALIAERLDPTLLDAIDDPAGGKLDALIDASQSLKAEVDAELSAGRDRLLELNSNRPEKVREQLDALARLDRDYRLQDFMAAVFDRFGVDLSEQRDHWIVKPGDHMQVAAFPMLGSEGLSVTFDRQTALAREDFTFLSWDHPMVQAAMDLILSEGRGQADIDVTGLSTLPHQLVMVEASYLLQCKADPTLNMAAWLPAELLQIVVGIDGRDYSQQLLDTDIDASRKRHDRKALRKLVLNNREPLGKVIDHTALLAGRRVPALVEAARDHIAAHHEEERSRLEALARVNPLVRGEELERLDARHAARLAALEDAQLFPVSVRVLLNLHD